MATPRDCGPKEVLRQAKYAVAAFLDEMVMNSRWPEKHRWASQMLQYELFGTQVAGVEFFDYLDTVRRKLPLNTDLLEVYYRCLALGFQGQYRLAGREKLKALIEDIKQDLQAKQGEIPLFSPNGKRPDEVRHLLKSPVFPLVASGIGLGVALLIYFVLAFIVSSDAHDVAAKLVPLTAQVTEVNP